MKKTYTLQDKEQVINEYRCGQTISSIHKCTGIARSTLYNWINECNVACNNKVLNIGD